MNIAVVTVYDGLNFGSYLQAFAMKSYLEGRGHRVVFVQRFAEEENLALFTTNRPKEDCGKLKRLWRDLREVTLYRKKNKKECQYYRKQFPYYQDAWSRLTLTAPEELEAVDCIICGSDEIWNLNNLNIDVPFYTCVGYGKNIKKLAVAASVGNSTREDFRKHPQVEEALKSFTEIIVRDRHSGKIVEDITGRKAEVVCDPTLLVDREIFREKKTDIPREKYLLVYTYGLTEEQSRVVSDFAKKNHYSILSACMDIEIAERAVYGSPLDFAKLVSEAECCFTTTFHGTIFSLLFAKRFCTIAKYPKIEDLISSLEEKEHLWDGKSSEGFERIMSLEVDREKLDRKLEEVKRSSSQIIDRALENVEKSLAPLEGMC